MTPGSQHPLRCETCGNFKPGTSGGESGMGSCVKSKRVITWQQWCIIRDVGCASHSSAPHPAASEQEIRADERERSHRLTDNIFRIALFEYDEAALGDDEKLMGAWLQVLNLFPPGYRQAYELRRQPQEQPHRPAQEG